MTAYRKKPVVINAVQWFTNGDHPGDNVGEMLVDPFAALANSTYERLEGAVVRFFRHPDVAGDTSCRHCTKAMGTHGWIDTLEGGHIVCPGDWIITGIQAERYPCKPDIFAATYEPVGDDQ